MIQILKNANYDFQSKRRIALAISAIVIVIGLIVTVARRGPNYSIDFVGGMEAILRFEKPITEGELRKELAIIGYPDAELKSIAGGGYQDIMIRIEQTAAGEKTIDTITQQLTDVFKDNPITLRSIETVGPKIGHELRRAAFLAVLASLILIVLYMSWRFQYRYGVAAVLATAHDVLVVFGLFSILNLQISLTIIAAFLTIVGYSLNDKIVVFDRVRENVKKLRSKSFIEQINISINETLSRTLLTGSTTIMVLIVLFFFGGSVIHDFTFAMLSGIIIGTYSSIYIASPIVIEWNLRYPEKRKKK